MAYSQLNLVQPIKPFTTAGLAASHLFVPIQTTASTAYAPGDLITLTNGAATVLNTDPAGAAVDAGLIGVCMTTFPSTASVTASDTLTIALACPGHVFEGTVVNGGSTDYTFSAGDLDTSAAVAFIAVDIDTGSGTRNVACLDKSDLVIAAGEASGIMFALSPSQTGGRAPGAIIHPRVLFCFHNTVFNRFAA